MSRPSSPPVSRVLVANRGEIARRIIRGAHDAGCDAVAVYASDDADSPHVGEADAAVLLPGATLGETYLDAVALVEAARRSGADALHPGYGFLSENPALAERCREAGITWVGPSPEAMRVMGHKARAKEVVAAAGVPVLPSAVVVAGATAEELGGAAGTVGFPLLVKASAGGGGRGMRLVWSPSDLVDAVASAQREAAGAFGSDEVFLERYLETPRHVEVQVLGDDHGTLVHLFDRECSVQRRHQKLVEEAPAVNVAPEVRRRMWDAAVAAAGAVSYVGAGTVEFLVDGGHFFFLEMNTRLQVEHGVTELVTGVDLVGLQLMVAGGEPLPFAQSDLATAGHAIEVRLCAERPREEYRPTPGVVTHVRWPSAPGIRCDRGVETGSVVSPAYDSLVAWRTGPSARVPRPGWRALCARSSSTASRPTGTSWRRCSTTGTSGTARSTCTISSAGPNCATPRPPRRCAGSMRRPWPPVCSTTGRPGASCPCRRPGGETSASRCTQTCSLMRAGASRSAPVTSASRSASPSTVSGAPSRRP